MVYAVCGPFYMFGSLLSSYISKHIGKRNALIITLIMHCIGDALFFFAGLSPTALILSLGIPSFAAAGVGTLLGVITFSSNIIQSAASKFAVKTKSLILKPAHRNIYFALLAALSLCGIILNNPVVITALYTLLTFRQAIAAVIEPSEVAKTLTEDESPYWFSFKIISTTIISTALQLGIAALLTVVGVGNLLFLSIAFTLAASSIMGLLFKGKIKNKTGDIMRTINANSVKNILQAA